MTAINTNLIIYFLKSGRKVRVYVTPGAHHSLNHTEHMHVAHANGDYVWVVNPSTDHLCRVRFDCIKHAFIPGEAEAPEEGNTLRPETDTRPEAERKCIIWNPKSSKPPRVILENRAKGEEVARLMANRNTGEEFYVAELVAVAIRPQPAATLTQL